ncbi:DUF4190 domain-containing protein [bacterium]|nr:DUF4190 domain-containing protein [bacterium]
MNEENTYTAEVETVNPQVETLKPHRGTTVLVLGILGIACCMICGIIAWVMGNNDLKEMDAGIMDPEGRGITQAGKICGIVSVGLQIIGLLIWIAVMILGVAAKVAS